MKVNFNNIYYQRRNDVSIKVNKNNPSFKSYVPKIGECVHIANLKDGRGRLCEIFEGGIFELERIFNTLKSLSELQLNSILVHSEKLAEGLECKIFGLLKWFSDEKGKIKGVKSGNSLFWIADKAIGVYTKDKAKWYLRSGTTLKEFKKILKEITPPNIEELGI